MRNAPNPTAKRCGSVPRSSAEAGESGDQCPGRNREHDKRMRARCGKPADQRRRSDGGDEEQRRAAHCDKWDRPDLARVRPRAGQFGRVDPAVVPVAVVQGYLALARHPPLRCRQFRCRYEHCTKDTSSGERAPPVSMAASTASPRQARTRINGQERERSGCSGGKGNIAIVVSLCLVEAKYRTVG